MGAQTCASDAGTTSGSRIEDALDGGKVEKQGWALVAARNGAMLLAATMVPCLWLPMPPSQRQHAASLNRHWTQKVFMYLPLSLRGPNFCWDESLIQKLQPR